MWKVYSFPEASVPSSGSRSGSSPGLCFSNELISRDEGLHQQFAVELFNMLKFKPNKDTIQQIVKEAVEIEKRSS